MFWVIARFMEECVGVSRFKENLGMECFVGGIDRMEIYCGVKEVYLLWVDCVFDLNCGMMRVQYVMKCWN